MPREPLHSFRAPDELWDEVQTLARRNGHGMSEILRAGLEAYIAGNIAPPVSVPIVLGGGPVAAVTSDTPGGDPTATLEERTP